MVLVFLIGGIILNITKYEQLEGQLTNYSKEDKGKIKRAYELAEQLHSGQTRQSGEPYITHPLNVAYIMTQFYSMVDADTLCAALLHDTIEDTDITKEEIEEEFGHDVAVLTDGVTKISKLNFREGQSQEREYANMRKIITSLRVDVRIIMIKLADRLHNMRTLQYKTKEKQEENAVETLELFVPLSYYIGAYRIKSELEDLGFKYAEASLYEEISGLKEKIEQESKDCLLEMYKKISTVLKDKEIPNEIKVRTKNIYGIYNSLSHKESSEERKINLDNLRSLHDLLALKVMVEEIDDCYKTLGYIHREYKPVPQKFKDYICNPKTNRYQSLHTTVFGPNEHLVQTQIRTFDMDKIASFGLTAYWSLNQEGAREKMQKDLREKYQFYKYLTEIDKGFSNNKEFIEHIKMELFTDKVYVYTPSGKLLEFPKGSSVIDFAYRIHTDIGNHITKVLVNEHPESFDYILKNQDRVKVYYDKNAPGPTDEWLGKVKTTKAISKIKKYVRSSS